MYSHHYVFSTLFFYYNMYITLTSTTAETMYDVCKEMEDEFRDEGIYTSHGARNNFEKREENVATVNMTSLLDTYTRRYTTTKKRSAQRFEGASCE